MQMNLIIDKANRGTQTKRRNILDPCNPHGRLDLWFFLEMRTGSAFMHSLRRQKKKNGMFFVFVMPRIIIDS